MILLGPLIKGAEFWKGFDIERETENWLDLADIVVLPAFVEHRPRRLLVAAAAGVPVIATSACGVHGIANVTSVPAGDTGSLKKAILNKSRRNPAFAEYLFL